MRVKGTFNAYIYLITRSSSPRFSLVLYPQLINEYTTRCTKLLNFIYNVGDVKIVLLYSSYPADRIVDYCNR